MSIKIIARDHCLAPERVDAPLFGGRYRSLFPELAPLDADETALHALGAPDGPCDLGEEAGDVDSHVAAVWPFFGQFIAHDITADRSPIAHHADVARLRNVRAPRTDLEGLYGLGPIGAPFMYEKSDPAKLLLSPGGRDVPRNAEGLALLGDPRNDVHLFTSQIAVAFIHMHNRLVERLRADGVAEDVVFVEARRAATWHYQHVILREFLPGLIGAPLAAELLETGPQLYKMDPDDPYIPFEFADAAYRYGHAQIRDTYMINRGFGPVRLFPDLMGFGPVPPQHAIDWTLQIDVAGHPPAQRAKRIDARLPGPLIALPTQITGSEPGTDYASLANRDLQRGQAVGLPSGETIARHLGVKPLTPAQVGLSAHGWTGETPLWWYILAEAGALHDGDRLGPVGGRIVGEVLVGIIDADPSSFRSVDPAWRPTLPARRPGAFGLADILLPTGVPTGHLHGRDGRTVTRAFPS
jgi:hypothetical protein